VHRHDPRLPAHAGLEAYSVLTRLPHPFRVPPQIAAEFLSVAYPSPRLTPDPETIHALPARLAAVGIAGGAVYDALIAVTAAHAGLPLVTLDRRAAETYRRLDVEIRLLA
jgi:predicted nucleic acid-binding protein